MNRPEMTALMKMVGGVVKDYVTAALAEITIKMNAYVAETDGQITALNTQLRQIQATKGERGDKGDPGESIRGEKGDPGLPGKDIDPEVIKSTIATEVAAAVAVLPPPKDGKDAEPVDRELIVTECLARIPAPKDGKDGASIVTGEGPPLSTGRDGDIYLDLKTGDIYRSS